VTTPSLFARSCSILLLTISKIKRHIKGTHFDSVEAVKTIDRGIKGIARKRFSTLFQLMENTDGAMY